MKTSSQLKNTMFIIVVAFVCGIVCSVAGCGGSASLDLPTCQSPVGATIDTETCVDYQELAICRWNAPGSGSIVGCVTAAPSSSGDGPGIECVATCPPNHYDTSPNTSR